MTTQTNDVALKVADRFYQLAEEASKLSKEVTASVGHYFKLEANSANLNVEIARTIFGKWNIEILAVLYSMGPSGFHKLYITLRGISHTTLSRKLKLLEQQRIVERRVLSVKPSRVQYSLTKKGITVAKLGEPVFLFLRVTELILPETEEKQVGAPKKGR